jgi:hypothetical protein
MVMGASFATGAQAISISTGQRPRVSIPPLVRALLYSSAVRAERVLFHSFRILVSSARPQDDHIFFHLPQPTHHPQLSLSDRHVLSHLRRSRRARYLRRLGVCGADADCPAGGLFHHDPTHQLITRTQREVAAFEPIAVYRREDINNFPAEQASQAPNGVVEPYNPKNQKRQAVNTFPAEQASQAPNGVVEPYNPKTQKRADVVPEEEPAQSLNGVVEPYNPKNQKRQAVNTFPAEQASQAPNGVVEPYNPKTQKRADVVPEEEPAQSLNGVVEPYNPKNQKRQAVNTFPAEQASQSPNGVVEPYNPKNQKRQAVNTFPAEQASQSPNGVVEPYNPKAQRRQDVPEQEPAQAPNGEIKPYGRRMLSFGRRFLH